MINVLDEKLTLELLTTEEAAELLRVDKRTLTRYVKEKRIQCHDYGQGYKFSRRQLKDFLEKTTTNKEEKQPV